MEIHTKYTVYFEPLAEGGYLIIVPAFPGIVTYGENLAEARRMAKEAIRVHIEGLLKDKEEIPKDIMPKGELLRQQLNVSVSSV